MPLFVCPDGGVGTEDRIGVNVCVQLRIGHVQPACHFKDWGVLTGAIDDLVDRLGGLTHKIIRTDTLRREARLSRLASGRDANVSIALLPTELWM
jgi:hypothetical protein